jgi:hypothetical protein
MKVAASVYRTEFKGYWDLLRSQRDTSLPANLALTLPTCCGRSDGIGVFRTEGHRLLFMYEYHILNKQPWTDDRGWSSSLEVGRVAKNPSS